MSENALAGFESPATNEQSYATTNRRLTRVSVRLPDETIQSVIENARQLSPDDDRVSFGTEITPRFSQPALSSILFEAECVHSYRTPIAKTKEPETLHLLLDYAPVTFDSHGEGHLTIGVTANPETHEVISLGVSARLYEDSRPDDCDCGDWNEDRDLPCWPCYRDGFETPSE